MSNALLETLENLRNLSHGPFETLERLGSLGNLSHGPLAKPWYFSHGPFETFFSAQAKVFVRKALPGDYRCFFFRGGGWGWELLLWEPWADSAHSNTSRRLGHRQLPSTQHALGLLLVPSFEAGLRLAPFAMHVPLACGQ